MGKTSIKMKKVENNMLLKAANPDSLKIGMNQRTIGIKIRREKNKIAKLL
jgi:hypothetical protein